MVLRNLRHRFEISSMHYLVDFAYLVPEMENDPFKVDGLKAKFCVHLELEFCQHFGLGKGLISPSQATTAVLVRLARLVSVIIAFQSAFFENTIDRDKSL